MKRKIYLIITLLILTVINQTWAHEACSRSAQINYQEVLVDTNSNAKGEGLRYYLDKDPVAKSYLDLYQKENEYTWKVAAVGTLGTGLTIAGLLKSKSSEDSGITGRTSLILTGVSLIVLNFFITKTLEFGNEKNLEKSVEEYNKRNLPKIYFSPFKETVSNGKSSPGLLGGFIKEF